jgi:tetratricopeptide (TPR) repeat protein
VTEKPLDRLRQLGAHYWQPLVLLLTGIPALLNALRQFFPSLSDLPVTASAPEKRWIGIGVFAFVFVIIRFPRVAIAITRLLLPPPPPPSGEDPIFRGLRPYRREDRDTFFGRKADFDACWDGIQHHPFFYIEGESGCGKSSLLNAMLLPRAEERFQVIECRVADDPFGKVYHALLNQPYQKTNKAVGESDCYQAIEALEDKKSTFWSETQTIPGAQIRQLQQALGSAFPNREKLEILIRTELDENLDLIAGGTDLSDTIFKLIKWAEARGRLKELVEKACRSNPDNPKLKLFVGQQSHLPLLLCIDQFEELFVTVPDKTRVEFFTFLKEALEKGKIRLLLVLRNDFYDLLDRLCREVDPEQRILNLGHYHRLRAFKEGQAKVVLAAMLKPLQTEDPLAKQEMEGFQNALIAELLRPPRDKRLSQEDEKTVLPVELQTIGMMLEAIGDSNFSVARLRQKGGKAGLYRDYIETAKTYVLRKTAVPGERSLLILRELISPAGTKWAQTAQTIAKRRGWEEREVEKVLQAFADQFLVNPLPEEPTGEDRGIRYELMHEHLVHVLKETPEPVLQKARDAEERLHFWAERTRVASETSGARKDKRLALKARLLAIFAQPIPFYETIRLWRYATDIQARGVLQRNLRGFISRSTVLFFSCALPILAWFTWTRSDAYQIHMIISEAPVVEAIDSGEIEAVSEWLSALIVSGHLNMALEVIQKITNDHDKARVLTAISEALVKIGNTDKASIVALSVLKAVENLTSDNDRTSVLIALSEVLVKTGNADKVLKAIPMIRFDYHKAKALIIIAKVLMKTGHKEKAYTVAWSALKAVQEAEYGVYDKAPDLIAVAEIFVKTGHKEKAYTTTLSALKVFPEMRATYERGSTLTAIAEVLLKTNNKELANTVVLSELEALKKITNDHDKALVLTAISEALVKTGNTDKILKAVPKKADDRDKFNVLIAIAKALVKTDDKEKTNMAALSALKAIPETTQVHLKVSALITIAEILVKIDDKEKANTAALSALKAAQAFSDGDSIQAPALIAIAEIFVKTGHKEKANIVALSALKAAQKIAYNERLSKSAEVAKIQARLHQYRSARLTCAECSFSDRLLVYSVMLTEYYNKKPVKSEDESRYSTLY